MGVLGLVHISGPMSLMLFVGRIDIRIFSHQGMAKNSAAYFQ